ncbi:MAG: purine-nucleoside phosphorylase [Lachnospiraceae bacterium]|nr:purine-nucleoside phosphorylase [Lachnospiraceae bacterium]
MADERFEKLKGCVDYVKSRTDFVPEIALILGSGLGDYARNMEVICEIPYSEIPGFPVSTAPGHDGRFIFGTIAGKKLVCMKGRIHYYEGYDISDVVLPTRLMRLLGAKILFLTNASGGINSSFAPGDFMIIKDHISSFAPNPLIGANMDELGVRFPDMTHVYDEGLRDKIKASAKELGLDVKEGVYIQLTGPSYESPAEIQLFKGLGADAVGMSTVVEAIAARHCGFKICGISCIANLAAGIADHELTAEEVLEAGKEAAPLFEKLVTRSIEVF